jgi:hypothetical protein
MVWARADSGASKAIKMSNRIGSLGNFLISKDLDTLRNHRQKVFAAD